MITDKQREKIYRQDVWPHIQILNDDCNDPAYHMINDYANGIKSQLKSRGIEITFDIVKNPAVNGFAIQVTGNEYLISVNTGIADMWHELQSMEHPTIIAANGPARVATKCIAHYILGHEVAHVMRGHVTREIRPFCFNNSTDNIIDEASVMDESDADALAGLTLSDQILTYTGTNMPTETQVSFFLLAMQLLTESWKRNGGTEGTHPHPYARYGILRSGILEGYHRKGITLNMTQCELYALDIFTKVLGSSIMPANWLSSVNDEYNAWYKKYFDRMDAHTQSRYKRMPPH